MQHLTKEMNDWIREEKKEKAMLERDLEKKLKRAVQSMKGLCYKFVSPGSAGVPDRIIMLRHGKIIFVELKTDTGHLSVLQNQQIRKIREKGQKVVVVYGESGVDKLIDFIKTSMTDRLPNVLR